MSFTRRQLFLSLAAVPLTAAAKKRPNILFIFADDLGWRDVGFNGTDFYETPNLDRLAREGMRFAQAYAGAGNCAPSRACLLSGQYTPRHGIYAVQSTKRGPVEKMRLEPVPNNETLAPENVTFAEAMRDAGYRTGHIGKWHLGGKPGARPKDQGFEESIDPRPNPNASRHEPDDPKSMFTITRLASEFLSAHSAQNGPPPSVAGISGGSQRASFALEKKHDRPFLLYVAHHAIHSNLAARPATLERFKAKAKGKQHGDPLYAACLFDFDDAVGQLLAKLDTLGLRDNTLVLFTSDNGGVQKSSQEPLRGNKGCYYEGGIREPMLVRWPGVTKPGSVCNEPVINLDFYPTFLDAAGARPPAGKVLDGESLIPLLKGTRKKLQRKAIYWHFPGYLDDPVIRGRDNDFRSRPVSVIRKGDWKLHLYHEEWILDGGLANVANSKAVELFDMKSDMGEHHNVALSNPAKRDELLADLLAWFRETQAPLPTRRSG